MKYLKLLEERQLSVTDLQKAVQKKISEIEILANKANELRQVEDLDEEGNSTLKELEQALGILDEYLARKIEIFNPEIYAKKLEVVKNAQSKRKHLSVDNKVEVNNDNQINSQEKEPEAQYQDELQDESEDEGGIVEEPRIEAKKAILQQKLEGLKQSVTVRDEHFEDGGEFEEFSKVDDVKPKKMTTPLIIMGIGALILTVGAVNFFKRR